VGVKISENKWKKLTPTQSIMEAANQKKLQEHLQAIAFNYP
jgi:hypothetical protein